MTDTPKKPNLADQIEKILENNQQTDTLDPDLATYLEQFLADFNAMQELPPIDLMSVESAQDAVKMLTMKKNELAAKMKVAQSLTKLLGNVKE